MESETFAADCTLEQAGIDTTIFKPYSIRSSAVSKAAQRLKVKDIVRSIGWTNERTFARFYHKKIVKRGCISEAVNEI